MFLPCWKSLFWKVFLKQTRFLLFVECLPIRYKYWLWHKMHALEGQGIGRKRKEERGVRVRNRWQKKPFWKVDPEMKVKSVNPLWYAFTSTTDCPVTLCGSRQKWVVFGQIYQKKKCLCGTLKPSCSHTIPFHHQCVYYSFSPSRKKLWI